jgi:hypothetical protein
MFGGAFLVWLFWPLEESEGTQTSPNVTMSVMFLAFGRLVLGMVLGLSVGYLGSDSVVAFVGGKLGLVFEAPNEIVGITWLQALRYSAESMAFQKPDDFVNLEQGLSPLRVWSWVQNLVGPFLFVMFGLALKNKLKR